MRLKETQTWLRFGTWRVAIVSEFKLRGQFNRRPLGAQHTLYPAEPRARAQAAFKRHQDPGLPARQYLHPPVR